MIYLDFAKAFDSVDHTIFLARLRVFGVSEQLLAWFTDYLTGRAQRVVLDGAVSQWAPATSGVPRGSLFGPLSFTIFLNNLTGKTVGGVRAALYADNSKLHKNVSSVSDYLSLQTTLANVSDWSRKITSTSTTRNAQRLLWRGRKLPWFTNIP